ncbi:MAG TPA: hypothetical protein GX700_00745 [Paracoccus sp.]|nr:hypothetical protein [Paracoccus sp. (in: a-proteobacteria)]
MIGPTCHHAPATDFERLEDIGASAICASRHALACAVKLDADTTHALACEIAELRRIVDERAALSGNARESLQRLADALRARLRAESSEAIGPVLEAIADCLTASERVADLLAARQHVGRWRGNA